MPRQKKTATDPAEVEESNSVVSEKKLTDEDYIANLNKTVAKCMKVMKPPSDITVTQWAERYHRMSPEDSAETGLYRVSRTPYMKEPMDAFTDPKVRRIVIVAPSQVGKSVLENNVIGYIIDVDPGSILFIQPTVQDAKEYSQLRIAPMIRDCRTLKAKVSEAKSRDSGNTILSKKYPGGILTLCGSTEAHALASKPIRYVLGDERDRWAKSAGDEGDPWLLAMARQTTFYNAKAVEVSTPTIKGKSEIEKSFYKGTMERYQTKCPHCGKFHEIRFKDIRFEYDEIVTRNEVSHKVNSVWYVCPDCGAISTEAEMKDSECKWIAENPAAYENGVRSFWLTAFVSPWASWESIILEFLNAKGDTKKLQVVFNTKFGELWEDRGDLENESDLMDRREDYGLDNYGNPLELPDGVLVLTCGIDTQDDRVEYEVVGHGFFGQTWGIQKGTIIGRPDSEELWDKIDEVIDKGWRYRDGIKRRISVTFMDEGGHFTQEVRKQCAMRQHKGMYAIKGFSGSDIPYVTKPKKIAILGDGKKAVGTCWQYQLGVDSGKQIIMDNLRVQSPESKNYCHFPRREDYGATYFKGLLSERLEYNEKAKKNNFQWVKIPGHERNEPLDIRNYANAAYRSIVNLDLDKLHDELENTRNGTAKTALKNKTAAQMAARPKPTPRTNRKYGGGVENYFNDW